MSASSRCGRLRVQPFRRALQTYVTFACRGRGHRRYLQDLSLDPDPKYAAKSQVPIRGLPFSEYLFPAIMQFNDTFGFPPRLTFSPTTVYATVVDSDCAKNLPSDPRLEKIVYRGNIDIGKKQFVAYSGEDFGWNPTSFQLAVTYTLSKYLDGGAREGNGWSLASSGALPGFDQSGEYYSVTIEAGLLSFMRNRRPQQLQLLGAAAREPDRGDERNTADPFGDGTGTGISASGSTGIRRAAWS